MFDKLGQGLSDILGYDAIENEHIKRSYPDYTITRWVSLFGGTEKEIPHEKVLIYCNLYGDVMINQNAPDGVKEAFRKVKLY